MLRILHAYKVYRPEVEGGIPEVIANLTTDEPPGQKSWIRVARTRGWPRSYAFDGISVKASASFGTWMSMPIAPGYPLSLALESARADVIVHHAPFPLNDFAVTAMRSRIALIVHWHADILGRAGVKAALMPFIRNSLARADRIIVSHPTMIDLSEDLKPFQRKCVAIPYGVDIGYWKRISVEQQLNIDDLRRRYARLIISVGRLVPYKGYPILLRALKGMDAHLVIVGDGPLLNPLKELAAQLDVTQNVTFAGRLARDEIKELLHAARVLALPSVTSAEAFGLVQIEAMAAGCPVVNTDLPTAVPFVARDGLEGLTVRHGDVDQLRSALFRILDDEILAKTMSDAAKVRAQQEFCSKIFRQRNFAIYAEAAAHKRVLSHEFG